MTDRELMTQALKALENAEDQLPKPYSTEARVAITALRARLAKTDGYACHCDLDPGQQPDGCVFDTGRTFDCMYAEKLAKESKGRNDCEYWQPIKWEEK